MKKILPILAVFILVLSGLGAVAVTESDEKLLNEESVLLSAPIFKKEDSYLTVDFKEATSMLLDTGKPMLPVVTKVYTFPLGTKIDDVAVTFSEINQQVLSKKIMPSPEPVPLLASEMESIKLSKDIIDENVYSSSELYPEERYVVRKGVGLEDNDHVIYLTVRCYPVQYAPLENTIYVANSIDIDVKYQPPKNPVIFPDIYDMVIITPEKFETQLQALVTHKNAMGIETTVKTVEDIYSEYSGRDDPEDIKLFIKDAIEDWGIDYVLLFGGRKGQSLGWDLPERVTNNADINPTYPEPGYASDLYYADIYKLDGNITVFDDWDSNGNDVFAEFKGLYKDVMDFYPDVHIGRIPLRYSSEVDRVINKIITYETTADDSWFKKAVFIGGDTSPSPDSYYEGEIENQVAIDWLEGIGFSIEKLWASLGTLNGVSDVISAYNDGAGILFFAGHGNPSSWSTHPPHEHSWITGFKIFDAWKLRNGDKTPFVYVGGCHNAMFNVTLSNILVGIKRDGFLSFFGLGEGATSRFYYYEWVPHDWCSVQVLRKGGGAIASIGYSALGYGISGPGTTGVYSGFLDTQHFNAYANQSKEIVGEMHSQAITDYINIVGGVNDDNIDRKTIDCSILIGDPSLKLGGY
ncbi:MAG: peptidase C25 [Thermoplasmatales archaeon]|nr:MAG: peptidase C25 [Thermoplasmatales archaeon]